MAHLINSAPTRQRTDPLWDSTTVLGSGGTFSGDIRLVAGYGGINLFISSNLSFRLRIEEGPTSSGPWTETDRITSALNDAGTTQIICDRIVPCGTYMRIFVDNLGGVTQTSFTLSAIGLPIGDATDVSAIVSGVVAVSGEPGATITSAADTTVGVGATAALTVPPANTRRMTVEVTGGDGTTRIRVREVGGGAGRGKLLNLLGSTMYGGADGAIAALEVENVAGPSATVAIQFERD